MDPDEFVNNAFRLFYKHKLHMFNSKSLLEPKKLFVLIQGEGIPNQLAGTDTMVAADMYDRDMGSSLTRISSFRSDPFLSEADKVRAEQHFSQYYPDLAVVFDNVANYNYVPFKQALIYLINVTKRFS